MMAEYFDTKAAINALVRLNNDSDMPTDWHKGVSSALSCLYRVPTVQPERKKGKWIWDDEGYHCSECWFHAHGNTLECMDGTYRFCPNCGAEMGGET